MVSVLGRQGYLGDTPKTQNDGGMITLGGSVRQDVVRANLVIHFDIAQKRSQSWNTGGQTYLNNQSTHAVARSLTVNANSSNVTMLSTPSEVYDDVLIFGNKEGTGNTIYLLNTTSPTGDVLTNNVTLDIWFRASDDWASADYSIFQNVNGFALGTILGQLYFLVRRGDMDWTGGNLTNPSTFNFVMDNRWHNLIITCENINNGNNSLVRLMSDGVMSNYTQNMAHSVPVYTQNLNNVCVGDATGSLRFIFSEPFQGYIGAVKVYDKLLSETEMTQNYLALRERYD